MALTACTAILDFVDMYFSFIQVVITRFLKWSKDMKSPKIILKK